jgi:hypothetical protein
MFDIAELFEDAGFEGWDGDMDVLVCPCGWTIEHDGQCPDGCVSPFLLGLI